MGMITRAIHDAGLALWWGGTAMGTLAMNPAVEVLDDPEERGKMVDEGWARFQPLAAAGLMAGIVSHIIMRRNPPRRPSAAYKNTARVKDALMVTAVVSSVASLALGEYAMAQDPESFAPVESATTPTDYTPEETVEAQAGLTISSWVQLASGLGLFIAGALLAAERED